MYLTRLPELHVASDSQRGRGEVEMMQIALKLKPAIAGTTRLQKLTNLCRTFSANTDDD